jgi:hypothetical protein
MRDMKIQPDELVAGFPAKCRSTQEILRGQHVHVHNVVSQSKGETQ